MLRSDCSAFQALLIVTARGQRGRRVVVQIADLRAHGLDADRRLKAEAAEHQPRLVGDVTEPGRDDIRGRPARCCSAA